MAIVASDLRPLPLFRELSESQIGDLLKAFTARLIKKGEVLFRQGDMPRTFQLLADGEIELDEPSEPNITLRPFSPIGELGALIAVPRNATATALCDSKVLEADRDDLLKLFAENAELGHLFYKGLLQVVGVKVGRDKQRLDEMRKNLIRTQKAMKQLRELVLEADESEISQKLCDRLDDLIENNRRAHYRVSPVSSHPAQVKLSGGKEAAVVELSEGYLKLDGSAGKGQGALGEGDEATMVLTLPSGELPVSGTVTRVGGDGILLKLDMLIEEYRQALASYMTELQMLDFVV